MVGMADAVVEGKDKGQERLSEVSMSHVEEDP